MAPAAARLVWQMRAEVWVDRGSSAKYEDVAAGKNGGMGTCTAWSRAGIARSLAQHLKIK